LLRHTVFTPSPSRLFLRHLLLRRAVNVFRAAPAPPCRFYARGLEYYFPVFYFDSMRTLSPLRGGIFIIECARFSFLTGILAVLRHNAGSSFPWQIYAVPNALFVLMALFLWLDTSKYTVYSLLYAAGKALCVFSEIMSGVAFFRNIRSMNFFAAGSPGPHLTLPIVFLVDVITLIIMLIIIIKNKNTGQLTAEPSSGSTDQNNTASDVSGGHGGA
ncbi:MAG: hypothetical protein FWF29_05215, partial [Treponema sp.]|nr:hypothetical protein [Treponema sp.]